MRDTVHSFNLILPLPGSTDTIEYLEEYGLKREEQVSPERSLELILAVAVALGLAALLLPANSGVEATDVTMAVAALGALRIGFEQWREARHEISMDKYYERLDIANKRRENGDGSGYRMMRVMKPEIREPNVNRMMLIYAELDNIEYVAEKYYLGYMTPRQACRGLRTFQGRCLCRDFRELALERVQRGDYNPETAEIVRIVCEKAEARCREWPGLQIAPAAVLKEKAPPSQLEIAAGIALASLLMIRHRI